MYKMPDEVINFIEITTKTCQVELTVGGNKLAETKVQRGIFQRDAHSPLQLIIAMIPLNNIPRKGRARYCHVIAQGDDRGKINTILPLN